MKLAILACAGFFLAEGMLFGNDGAAAPGQSRVDISRVRTGLNVNSLNISSWSDPAVVAALKQLRPEIVRFPGGTVANYWDWQKGGIISDLPKGAPAQISHRRGTRTALTLDKLAPVLAAQGAEPIFVLNMYTSTLDQQLAMLRFARASHAAVHYIELGNELYWAKYRDKFSTGGDYARVALEWNRRIKAEFPGAETGLVLQTIDEDQAFANATSRWNHDLFAVLRRSAPAVRPDALILHPYSKPGGGEYGDLLKRPLDDSAWALIFSSARASSHKVIATLAESPLAMKCWITEYAAMDEGGLIESRWAHTLYTLSETLSLISSTSPEILTYHSFLGPPAFSTHASPAYQPVYQSRFGRAPQPYALLAPGLALWAANAAKTGMNFLQATAYPPAMSHSASGSAPSALIWAFLFSNSSIERCLLLNLSPTAAAVPLAVRSYHYQDGLAENYQAPPTQPILDISRDIVHEIRKVSETTMIPAYSFTFLH